MKPGKIVPASFYARDTEIVAREMLGLVLQCRTTDGLASGVIVETEAYLGEHDPACHAAVGRTARTEPLYGAPGTAYVYFIYGMYWCFNAVTRAAGLPGAVLVRAVEPLQGLGLIRSRRLRVHRDEDLTNGPGKLCLALDIGRGLKGAPLQRGPLVIREGVRYADDAVEVDVRIGITKAADWPLRWLVRGNSYVSKLPRR